MENILQEINEKIVEIDSMFYDVDNTGEAKRQRQAVKITLI